MNQNRWKVAHEVQDTIRDLWLPRLVVYPVRADGERT